MPERIFTQPAVGPAQERFSLLPSANVERSAFDRSHGLKTTLDAGLLVPIYADEALPGDTFHLNMNAFGRLATPIFPIMDNIHLETFFFAVPLRLVWEHFVNQQGERPDPDSPGPETFTTPTMTSPQGGYLEHSLSDYLGLPIKIAGLVHSSLFHRAYALIYNEWFRSQDLQDSAVFSKGDGPDDPDDYPVLRRCKKRDYFTSCLPNPQKGDDVLLPLGTVAPVTGTVTGPNQAYFDTGFMYPESSISNIQLPQTTGTTTGDPLKVDTSALSGADTWHFAVNANKMTFNADGLYTNLESATAATINQIREAFQMQILLERDQRGGTRYTEIIRSHFGVISPDARLQRPEYLGGGHTMVNIAPISRTDGAPGSGTGQLSGYGTVAVTGGHGFTKSFTEHSIILGIVNVRGDITYQQGLQRMFTRSTRYDYYLPALAHLGEQPVLNQEIYAQGTGDDALTFGYQERYAEYRYKPSQITGLFRSTATGTLHAWHLSEQYTVLPELGPSWIEDNTPIDRVIAVNTQPHVILDCWFNLRCVRPMPVYSIPGLVDHF